MTADEGELNARRYVVKEDLLSRAINAYVV